MAALLTVTLACLVPWNGVAASPPQPDDEPAPMVPAEFQTPSLPESPTQTEWGANLYFYHCMPCHGDQGQGLTDEFRALWIPDHQNCWAPGCHTGRPEDQGFPIPRTVPGLLTLSTFPNSQSLFAYLQATHPPQNPGYLEETDYWALTAFVLQQAGRLPAGEGPLGPESAFEETGDVRAGTAAPAKTNILYGLAGGSALLGVILLVSLALARQNRPVEML